MLYEIMRHIRNFFPVADGFHDGTYTISGGVIDLPFAIDGEYVLIEGSLLNDGVYRYPIEGLTDETFEGTITELAPPREFLTLAIEIEDYQREYGKASPYQSESFGGYSYSKASGANGAGISWQDSFRTRLNAWRKV